MSLADGKTAADYIAEALELLNTAAKEMKSDSAYAQYLPKIERSCAFVTLISEEISRDPSLNRTETASVSETETSAYVPTVLPVDELLEPIPGDEPGGIDCRLEGDMNTLLSLVVNRKREADFQPQYGEAAKLSLSILKTRSKDLGVAVRLIECAFIQYGLPALADGLLLLNGMMDRFWMELYPEYDEYDFEPRANDLMNLQELICRQINVKFGGAHLYSPSYGSRSDADQEKAVVDAILAEMDRMNRFTYENFGDDAPDFNDLTSDIKTIHSAVMQKYKYYTDQDQYERNARIAGEEAAVAAELEEESRRAADEKKKQEMEAALESMPKIFKQPQNLDDVKERLLDCSQYLLSFHPEDPLPYLIDRALFWHSPNFRKGGESPDSEDRKMIGSLLSGGRWNELLVQCETSFQKGASGWYDLQKIQADAAEKLGGKFSGLAHALTRSAADYLGESPELLKGQLPDMTPSSSEDTREWIAANQKTAVSDAGSAGSSGGTGDPFGDSIRETVDELAKSGKPAEAFALLRQKERNADSERERCIWKLQTAEFAIRNGQAKYTVPFVEELVTEILSDHVRRWECSTLRTRVLQAAYDTYLYAFGQQKAPADRLEFFYNHICRINPGYFIQSR